jgi:hypothetical protein
MDITQVEKYFDKFNLRVKEVERKTSQVKEDGSGGNPMDVVTCEFINNKPLRVKDPETGEIVDVNADGLDITAYVVYSEKALGQVNTFLKAIGESPVRSAAEGVGLNGATWKGRTAEALVNFSSRPLKNSGGEIITNGAGKPVTTGDRKVSKWLPKLN